MEITDYEINLLEMLKKFGPAISSVAVEKREAALQELVKEGLATMSRNEKGQMKYVITREGRAFLEENPKPTKK